MSALVAFLAYFLGSFTILGLFRAGGLIIFAGPPAIAFAIAVLSARSAVGRVPPWMAAFVFPGVFTAYEFLYSLISANGTYWSLGYSQTDFLPVLQIVSVAGLWGVIFLVTLVPSAASVSWHRRAPSALAPAFAMLVLAVGYGAVRLSRSANEGGVRIGLAALDSVNALQALDVARAYGDRARELAASGADIVVFPEKVLVVTAPEADAVMKIFSDVSRVARVTLIVGLNRSGGPLQHNVAVVFANGEVMAEYEKHHLVPLIEAGFARGTTPRLFSGPGAQWGVAICKDMDFPSWSREYGRRGVRLLAVPALDFVRDGRMHSRMAVTRGVENGFAVARAAGQGVVTVSDAYGRVLAEQQSAVDGRLVHPVRRSTRATATGSAGQPCSCYLARWPLYELLLQKVNHLRPGRC